MATKITIQSEKLPATISFDALSLLSAFKVGKNIYIKTSWGSVHPNALHISDEQKLITPVAFAETAQVYPVDMEIIMGPIPSIPNC